MFIFYVELLLFTLFISLCFSRLTISSMISPSPRTSLQINVHRLIRITASIPILNGEVSMCPAVFFMTQFSRAEPCSSALPGASCLWVHHFADHTLPGIILLLGEGPLCRESSFLFIRHHCREWAEAESLLSDWCWVTVVDCYIHTARERVRERHEASLISETVRFWYTYIRTTYICM